MPCRLGSDLVVLFSLAGPVAAGTYSTGFAFPNQSLTFDQGPPGMTVLAPAVTWRGILGDDTTLALFNNDLVAGDPTGGSAAEYSVLALHVEPPNTRFASGTLRVTVAGETIRRVRDGELPGVAVGLARVDSVSGATYFFAAINRTTAGPNDYFNNIAELNASATALPPKGIGHFAVWEVATAAGGVKAAQPIPAGPLSDCEFRIDNERVSRSSFSFVFPRYPWHPLIQGDPGMQDRALPGSPVSLPTSCFHFPLGAGLSFTSSSASSM
jgi:hypothetical protein